MTGKRVQGSAASAWSLARRQHGVITRRQLLELGFTSKAIEHRLAAGRLHRAYWGVYAVGRPQVSRKGGWMAAALASGPGTVLNHESAAALWGLPDRERGRIRLAVPRSRSPRNPGLVVHRRHNGVFADATTCDGIPVTSVVRTLIDLATRSTMAEIETLVNQADRLDLVHPEPLRRALEPLAGEPGAPILRRTLDRRTFTLTDSELERRFLPIARRAGLPKPETQVHLNGYRVDFYWRDLRLVVETDGLRYHRTAAQQARDRLRDQAHMAAGDQSLRFTHAQIRYEPGAVERTMAAVAGRLRMARS